jgi:hypothetical protein
MTGQVCSTVRNARRIEKSLLRRGRGRNYYWRKRLRKRESGVGLVAADIPLEALDTVIDFATTHLQCNNAKLNFQRHIEEHGCGRFSDFYPFADLEYLRAGLFP